MTNRATKVLLVIGRTNTSHSRNLKRTPHGLTGRTNSMESSLPICATPTSNGSTTHNLPRKRQRQETPKRNTPSSAARKVCHAIVKPLKPTDMEEIKEIKVTLNAYNLLSNFTTKEIADYLNSIPGGDYFVLENCSEFKLAQMLVSTLGLKDALDTVTRVDEEMKQRKHHKPQNT